MKMTVLLVAVFALSTCELARAEKGTFYFTADALATDCRTAIRIRDNPESPSPQAIEHLKDAQLCIGYVTGALDAFEFERVSGSQKYLGQSPCVPADVKSTQAARVFAKYADDHPEELHFAAPLVLQDAMLAAFPCAK